jgi:hypothetical protein
MTNIYVRIVYTYNQSVLLWMLCAILWFFFGLKSWCIMKVMAKYQRYPNLCWYDKYVWIVYILIYVPISKDPTRLVCLEAMPTLYQFYNNLYTIFILALCQVGINSLKGPKDHMFKSWYFDQHWLWS